MPTPKTKPPASQPGVAVHDCVFTNNTAANEHTRAAVEALARAAEANANAISAVASALKGAPVNGSMLAISGQGA